jgi:hypothetical protein
VRLFVKPLSTRLKQAPLAKISPNISEISDAGEGIRTPIYCGRVMRAFDREFP